MSRAPSTFRQRDLTRALKAAKAAGYDSVRITVKRDGFAIDERLANANDVDENLTADDALARWQRGRDHAG